MLYLLLGCGTQEIVIDDINTSQNENTSQHEHSSVEERPTENIPATVEGEADIDNGAQIHDLSCLACHPNSAPSFEQMIPQVTDLEIETAIRNGKKGVPAALGEKSPPDGALSLNLTDQDIVDVIAFVREEYGLYEP